MKINRPLSPHLTVYKPQLTSTLSIFHRISGAFLALSLIASFILYQSITANLNLYPFYWCLSLFLPSLLVFAFLNIILVAFSYHMNNGIRHLLWDSGFFLDLTKVYASGKVVILSTVLLAFFLIYLL